LLSSLVYFPWEKMHKHREVRKDVTGREMRDWFLPWFLILKEKMNKDRQVGKDMRGRKKEGLVPSLVYDPIGKDA
jgi:hypothetical protein